MTTNNPKPTETDEVSDLGFNPKEQMPQVANQSRSNGTRKGIIALFLLGCILFVGFLGFRSAISNSNEEAETAAAAVKKQQPNVPEFSIPAETASEPAAPADAMASSASQPVTLPPVLEPQPVGIEQPVEAQKPVNPDEIRLSSPLMVGQNSEGSGTLSNIGTTTNGGSQDSDNNSLLSRGTGSGNGQTELSSSFNATATPSGQASRLKNRNMLLAKGTVLTCNMATRLETQIAGQSACVIPNDIYSVNGNVVLLERGTVVEGEYQRVAEVGRTRIFVLWTRARTPKGVTVNLDSAASDRLGGAGMDGYVNNHWFKRFGNALMFSLIQDGISTGFQRLEKSQTAETVVYENSEDATDKIVEEIIKSTANIPPTIYRNQGDKVGIYISRDLDFSSVYRLQSRTAF